MKEFIVTVWASGVRKAFYYLKLKDARYAGPGWAIVELGATPSKHTGNLVVTEWPNCRETEGSIHASGFKAACFGQIFAVLLGWGRAKKFAPELVPYRDVEHFWEDLPEHFCP